MTLRGRINEDYLSLMLIKSDSKRSYFYDRLKVILGLDP